MAACRGVKCDGKVKKARVVQTGKAFYSDKAMLERNQLGIFASPMAVCSGKPEKTYDVERNRWGLAGE
jgi:hypothetical protein